MPFVGIFCHVGSNPCACAHSTVVRSGRPHFSTALPLQGVLNAFVCSNTAKKPLDSLGHCLQACWSMQIPVSNGEAGMGSKDNTVAKQCSTANRLAVEDATSDADPASGCKNLRIVTLGIRHTQKDGLLCFQNDDKCMCCPIKANDLFLPFLQPLSSSFHMISFGSFQFIHSEAVTHNLCSNRFVPFSFCDSQDFCLTMHSNQCLTAGYLKSETVKWFILHPWFGSGGVPWCIC